MTRPIKPWHCTFLVYAIFALTACGGGDGGSTGSDSNPDSNSSQIAQYLSNLRASGITIPRETGEERVMTVKDATTGEVITVRGDRDNEASVHTLTRIESVTSDQKTNSVAFLENGNRQFRTFNGVQLNLSRTESGSWLVDFFDPETGTSFKTNLTQNLPSALPLGSSVNQRAVNAVKAALPNPARIPVTVKTTNCGKPADMPSNVDLILQTGTGQFLGSYRTQKIGIGTYQGFVPDSAQKYEVSLTTVKNAIQTTAKALDIACAADAAQPFAAAQACTSISAAMASTVIAAPVAAKFFAACGAAVATGKLACKVNSVINPSLPVPDYIDPASADLIPNLTSILEAVLPDSIFGGIVTPTVNALPAPLTGTAVTLKGSEAVATSIDLTLLDVGNLVLTPSAPSTGVGYAASANLQCIKAGSSATLMVSGTDDYNDGYTRSYGVNTTQDLLSLNVPGAKQSGIRDTVTLKVAQPIGLPTVTRTAYLVFQ